MSEDGTDVRLFKVLSAEESGQADLAPDQKGVFSLYAFRELPAAAVLNVSDEGGDLTRPPARKAAARSLTELQAALRSANHTHASSGRLVAEAVNHRQRPARIARKSKAGRGLVVEDSQASAGTGLNRLDKSFEVAPSMSLSIRYYSGPTPFIQ